MPGVVTAYQTGVHGSRPANGTGCILYSCTTHSLVYRDDGTSWSTFATLGTSGALIDPMTTRGDIITRGASAAQRLALGAAGKLLSSDGTDAVWGQGPLTTTGDLLIGATGGTPTRLGIGAAGRILSSDGTTASWGNGPMTTQDDLIVGGASGVPTRLAKGSDGQVLTVDPTTHHLVWATSSSGFSNPMTTKGDVIVGDTGGSAIRKAVGSDGQVLTADAASTGGIKWAAGSGGATSPLQGAPGTGSGTGGKVTFADASGGAGGAATVTGGNSTPNTQGGDASLVGGTSGQAGASITASGGTAFTGNLNLTTARHSWTMHGNDDQGVVLQMNTGSGHLVFNIIGTQGRGQALVDGGSNGQVVWGGIRIGSGVPSGAPASELPFAIDTSTTPDDLYYWNGSAWVLLS